MGTMLLIAVSLYQTGLVLPFVVQLGIAPFTLRGGKSWEVVLNVDFPLSCCVGHVKRQF